MKDKATVTNIMADGTICEDLSTYLDDEHQLPELAKQLIIKMMESGQRIRDGG